MAIPLGGPRESVGLHVDGQRIQLAHLRREGRSVKVLALRSERLVAPLDVEPENEDLDVVADVSADAGDILGLNQADEIAATSTVLADSGDGSPPQTNAEVLYQLLGDIPLGKCTVALSVAEGRVLYAAYPDGFGLKGRRLKKRLLAAAGAERPGAGGPPLADRHDSITTDRGAVLSMTHEDPLQLIALIDELKPFVGKVQIGLVDTPEIALMNGVRLAYAPEQKVSAIVYVGQEFSRVVFMQNGHYLAFSQPIHEGAGSPQVLNTLARRMLFEQDLSGIPEIGAIHLSGECFALDAQPYFTEQFPNTPVDYLGLPPLDTAALDERDRSQVSGYAVPVALAWKTLAPSRAPLYRTNLLPEARRRQQNPFEVAWHGVLLLGLLLISFPVFGWKAQEQSQAIAAVDFAIELAEKQIEESRPLVELVDDLHAQIQDYQHNLSLMDTLGTLQVVWSELLQDWAGDYRTVGGLWLEGLSSSAGNTDIQVEWRGASLPVPTEVFTRGRSLDRVRVSEIATQLGDGQVRSLVGAEVRGRGIFDFDIVVPISDSTRTTSTQEP